MSSDYLDAINKRDPSTGRLAASTTIVGSNQQDTLAHEIWYQIPALESQAASTTGSHYTFINSGIGPSTVVSSVETIENQYKGSAGLFKDSVAYLNTIIGSETATIDWYDIGGNASDNQNTSNVGSIYNAWGETYTHARTTNASPFAIKIALTTNMAPLWKENLVRYDSLPDRYVVDVNHNDSVSDACTKNNRLIMDQHTLEAYDGNKDTDSALQSPYFSQNVML